MPTLFINAQEQQFDVPDDMPLLWVLRDVAGLTGTKFGCGVALCGACTMHLDGRPIRSFAWSRDGQRLALTRSTVTNDIVLFEGLN